MATGEQLAHETKKYSDKKIKLTPFGIDTDLFSPGPEVLKRSLIKIGIHKSLKKVYNISALVEMTSLLRKRGYDVELHIAGEGPEKSPLAFNSRKT